LRRRASRIIIDAVNPLVHVIVAKKSWQNIINNVCRALAAVALFFCAPNIAKGTVIPATVSFSLTNAGLPLNPAFCGLSYDKSLLTGSLFVTNDPSMIQMFSQIAPAVLRIGADSVDTTCWGGLSNLTAITPAQVDAFAAFVKALPTNWHVIYGINMSVNNPTNCAAEAAYAAAALGPSLLGFEIGNEVDEYANNGIRASTYTYAQFLSQWQALAAAITNTVPGWAVTNGGIGWTLTGPVSAYNTTGFTIPFASDEAGVISMVTQHYYRGDGESPDATMALLLEPDTSLPGTVSSIATAATAAGLPLGYRTDECNSYYGGGSANVSDAYGAALWTLDFMFISAINGCQGVNFHGGYTSEYTPIFDNGTSVVDARPVFYGLKMFSLLPQGRVMPAIVSLGSSINFTAYGVQEDSGAIGAILNNKETNDSVQVSINLGSIVTAAQMTELTGPSLNSTNGYTIGGATINPDGSWAGGVQAVLSATNGQLTITVPPMSAVLLTPVAPTVYWTGASSAEWTDSGNWLSNTVPTAASDVVFSFPSISNFSTTLGQDTTVNSLSMQETASISISGNSLTINAGGINMLSAYSNATINSALVLGAPQNWAIAPNRVLTINGSMSGAGNLTLGQGTVILTATNTCTGTTTISNGTLVVDGSMTDPIVVRGGILSGTGVLTGPVSVSAGGAISPGPGVGELFVSNTLALQSGGSASMDVNASTGASDEIAGMTQLTYGGALVLNNQAGSFSATNTFKLFDAASYAGAFSSISPAIPAPGLDWNTSTLATDGTLRIIDVVVAKTTNVVESRSGNSTSGVNNPAFSFTGFSSTISATKSSAVGCTSPGSSRFTSTASTSTSFSVTPTLLAGTTYTVSVSWGYNSSPYGETPSIVVRPSVTGVSTNTFPATTTVFSSGSGDAINNTWETIGNITPNVNSPTITFTYVSGLSSGRWYADAVRFISQLPGPGAMTVTQTSGNFILNWQGNFILQSATNVSGPYTDVFGPVVAGPYSNTTGLTQQFFRLRQ
jgi:autotransporter-associated beta strand protein